MSSGKGLLVERSMRSILVGSIPNEASEGNLRDLLSEFGPILNVRYFKDGTCQYAFCEYGEQEMALRAIRNLANYEMRGRSLKVDIAASERSKEELARLQSSESEASERMQTDITTEKAPEEISKAVASLPAEQMFELMKQMKMCIENNPQEARNLLLQNPQLAYALLQAQVIMRIVDPEVAVKILNRPNPLPGGADQEDKPSIDLQQALPAVANSQAMDLGDQDLRHLQPMDRDLRLLPSSMVDKDMRQFPADSDLRTLNPFGSLMDKRPFDPRFRPADPRAQQVDPRAQVDPRSQQVDPRSQQVDPRSQQVDPRSQQVDPRSQQVDPRSQQVDPRMMQATDPRIMPGLDPRVMQVNPRVIPVDPRAADPRMMVGIQGPDPRMMPDPRALPMADPRGDVAGRLLPGAAFGLRPSSSVDPRVISTRVEDPRKLPMPANVMQMPPGAASMLPNAMPGLRQPPPAAASPSIPEDEEKAALIMQVLQLSDDQIAVLPPEQRQSIMVLKDQIARSQLTL